MAVRHCYVLHSCLFIATLLATVYTTCEAVGEIVRNVCSLPPIAAMVYVGGFSPESAASAHCERCISAIALARFLLPGEGDPGYNPEDVYGFDESSPKACHAVKLTAITGIRGLCRDCSAEVEAVEKAWSSDSSNSCEQPMLDALEKAKLGCSQVSIPTEASGEEAFSDEDAQNSCLYHLSIAHKAFQNGAPADSQCVITRSEYEEESKQYLEADQPVPAWYDEEIPLEFEDVKALNKEDLVSSAFLGTCYVGKPFSLALETKPEPFCDCLLVDTTETVLGPRLVTARRIYRSTDDSVFGINALIRESLRAILVDAAECLEFPANSLVTDAEIPGFDKGDPEDEGDDQGVPSATPSPSPTPNDPRFNLRDPNPSCFPASANVSLSTGWTRMDELRIGDVVQIGRGITSDVFMFTHMLDGPRLHEFVRIRCQDGRALTLSPGHYVPIWKSPVHSRALVAAETVSVGDLLETADADFVRVTAISRVNERGLYNPQTLHGDIVVDGLVVSTFTTAVHPTLAQSLLAPSRWVYRLGIKTWSFGLLSRTGHWLSRLVASGPPVLTTETSQVLPPTSFSCVAQ